MFKPISIPYFIRILTIFKNKLESKGIYTNKYEKYGNIFSEGG